MASTQLQVLPGQTISVMSPRSLFDGWFTTIESDYPHAILASSIISILATVLGLYTFVTALLLQNGYRRKPKHIALLSEIFGHLVVILLLVSLSYRSWWTYLIRQSSMDILRFLSEALFIFSLVSYWFTQHIEIEGGARPQTFIFCFVNAIPLSILSYTTLMEYDAVAFRYVFATTVSCLLALVMVLREGLRLPKPELYLQALSDDIEEPSEDEADTAPVEHASMFSKLGFHWVWPLIRIGRTQVLTEKDWPKLQKSMRSFFVRQDFDTLWHEESVKEKPSLMMVLIRMVWKTLLGSGILYFISTIILGASLPLILYLFVRFLEDRSADMGIPILPGLVLASSFAFVDLGRDCLSNFSESISRNATVRIESSLINEMLQSVLRISPGGKSKKAGDYVNRISTDIERIETFFMGKHNVHDVWTMPILLIVYSIVLSRFLGIFTVIPIILFLGIIVISYPWGQMAARLLSRAAVGREQRSNLELDVISNIRAVKMGVLGEGFKERLISGREKSELPSLLRQGRLNGFFFGFMEHCTVGVAAITFGCFAAWSGTTLTPEIIFPAWQVISSLEFPIKKFYSWMKEFHNCLQSVQRIQDMFLSIDEEDSSISNRPGDGAVRIQNGSFAYDKETEVLKDINFEASGAKSYCFIGRVGSGKSSMCKAILGEMITTRGRVQKPASIAYAAQKPWIFNGTVRDNIIFGNPEDPDFYEQTIRACALEHDLKGFPKGDLATVGEEGIQLSGGQKARLSLARAVYARADLYIMDDILAAVDQHTARHLIDQVLGSAGILKNRTRIMVSNHVQMLKEVDNLIFLEDGAIVESTESSTIAKGSKIELFMSQTTESVEADSGVTGEVVGRNGTKGVKSSKVLEVQTDVYDDKHANAAIGTMAGFKRYIKLMGHGPLVIYLILMALAFSANFMAPIWLQFWSESNVRTLSNQLVLKWIGIGVGIFLFGTVILGIQLGTIFTRNQKAAKIIYRQMISALFAAPMRFFEIINAGQTMNRLNGDLYGIDVNGTWAFNYMIAGWTFTVEIFFYIAITMPILIAAIGLSIPVMTFIAMCFLKTSSQLKRSESTTRGVLFGQIKECNDGKETIRAYRKAGYFVGIFEEQVDAHLQTVTAVADTRYWVEVQIRSVAAIFVFLVPMHVMWDVWQGREVSTTKAVTAVSICLNGMKILRQLVITTSAFATNVIALDRCFEYADIPAEKEDPVDEPTGIWPNDGKVVFRDFSIRYRPELDLALRSINLSIEPNQRIGVVGRTGAGKSSLITGLFRTVNAARGKILIDGVDISRVKLSTLRKGMALIPQDAALFKGTIRYNIDLESQYEDRELWEALDKCQIKPFVESLPKGLDTEVESRGSNLSSGQIQLISLARSFLDRSRILVLDEGTANVDAKTDALIQNSIKEISKSRTVLTIAHRINTVLDSDRIIVLADGRIAEEGAPQDLLKRRGLFYELAKESKIVG